MNSRTGHIAFLRIPSYFGMVLTHPQEKQLPLSIASTAACLMKAGHSVRVFDLWVQETTERELLAELKNHRMDMLVLQVDSMNLDIVIDVASKLNSLRPDLPLVAMGQYAEVMPKTLLPPNGPFKACLAGEPEATLVELADHLLTGKSLEDVAGIVWSEAHSASPIQNPERPLLEDLDTLPHPAYGAFDLDAYGKQSAFVPIAGRVRWGWMLSSRGCPFGCLFCSPTLRKSCGSKYRAHSPAYVADVAEELVHEFGCNALAFEDDVFSLSKERTLGVCDELISRDLDLYWTAQTHLSTISEEVATRMYKAGCRGLCMGIESGDDEVRRRIKGGSLSQDMIYKNAEILRKAGIPMTLYFMIGSPGETLEQMERTLELALSLEPMMIQLAFFTPYPGSKAWDDYMDAYGEEPEQSHYNRFAINLSGASREEVFRFYRKFYRRFYLNPKYMYRFLRHRFPYTIRQNGGREWKLLLRSLLFMAVPGRAHRLPWIPHHRSTGKND